MAPFTHVSRDRPSRFSDGGYGVLYAGDAFETALFETIHHHARFMAGDRQPPGWTSQFREIVLDVSAWLHDLRGARTRPAPRCSDPADYAAKPDASASGLRAAGSEGVVYPSVRCAGGECVGLFYPDCASHPVQGRHLDYHWDGTRVACSRDLSSGEVYRIV